MMYTPAWPGGDPGSPDFNAKVAQQDAADLALLLRRIFPDRSVSIRGRLRPGCGLEGHFRFSAGSEDKILHVKPAVRQGWVERAIDISCHLAACGAPVSAYERVGGTGIWSLPGGLQATITAYLPARHFAGTTADCRSLGQALRAVHDRMASYPAAAAVRAAAAERAAALQRTCAAIARGCPDSIPEAMRQYVILAASRYDPEFGGGNAICLHGDVSPGNVLFVSDGSAVLCDFEDAAFAFGPAAFDLAGALLRFARGATLEEAAACKAALIAGYGADWQPDSALLRNLLDHNFLIMAEAALAGESVHPGEWKKFAGLAAVV